MNKKIVPFIVVFCGISLLWGSMFTVLADNALPDNSSELIEQSEPSKDEFSEFPKFTKMVYGFQNPDEQLKPLDIYSDELGNSHYMYQQVYLGVPIYGQYMSLHVNRNKKLYNMSNNTDTSLQQFSAKATPISVTPTLTAEQALELFVNKISGGKELGYDAPGNMPNAVPESKLTLLPEGEDYRLVYEVNVTHFSPHLGSWHGFVDATDGRIIRERNKLKNLTDPNQSVGTGYGYHGSERTLNTYYSEEYEQYQLIDKSRGLTNNGVIDTFEEVLGSENQDYGFYYVSSNTNEFYDAQAVDAHYNAGLVYDYYQSTFGRDSYDDQGMDVTSIVHMTDDYGDTLNNAYWNSWLTEDDKKFGAVFYGDGDYSRLNPSIPDCYSCALDVVAHEMTHGINDFTAGLLYENQSGALSESISDIMGSIMDGNWTIGEDTGTIVRSMNYPEQYGDPMHMDDYMYLTNDLAGDYGGVHWNSGIPNHAAYLIAILLGNEGLDSNDILAKLVYRSLTTYLYPAAQFTDFRDAMISSVGDIGISTYQQVIVDQIVRQAWTAVGLGYATPMEGLIHGKISLDNLPYAGAQIEILQGNSSVQTVFSDSEGLYHIKVPEGTYEYRMRASGYIKHEQTIEVGENHIFHMPIELKVPFFHGAVVTAASLQNIAGASLHYSKKQGDGTYIDLPLLTEATNQYSWFHAELPGSGTYQVDVSAQGYVTQTYDFDFPGDTIVHYEFRMVPARGVRGHIGYEGAAQEDVRIDVYEAEDLLNTVYTNDLGNYEFELPAGSYDMKISKYGFVMNELSFELDELESDLWETMNVELQRLAVIGDLGSVQNGKLSSVKDYVVNNIDFSIWLGFYLRTDSLTIDELAKADFNGDNIVDSADYTSWLGHYRAYRHSRGSH